MWIKSAYLRIFFFLPPTQTLIFKFNVIFALLCSWKITLAFLRRVNQFLLPPMQTLFFLKRAVITILYMEKVQVSEIRRSRLFPFTYPDIIFLNNSRFCFVLYGKSSSLWKREGKSVSISLPPMTTLKIFFNAVICHKIYSLKQVWIKSP